jgi:hypothetical protein
MKLTKGKISKLYGKQKQSRRKNKKRKTSNKNRTFRRKRNLNLMRKSLKRYRGGVDTNQVVGQSLEGTTQEENPVTNLTQGEDLGFPPNQVTSNEDLSPPPPIDESLDPKKVEDLSPPPPPIDESLAPVVKDEDLSSPPPPIDEILAPVVKDEVLSPPPIGELKGTTDESLDPKKEENLSPPPIDESLAPVVKDEELSPPPPIGESLDPKKVEDLSPPPPIGESLSPDLAKKPDILASSLEDLPQAQEIPVVEAVPVEGTDPDIEQKLKIADAATNLVKLINTNDILIPQNAEISVGLAAEQIPIQIEEETKAAIDTKETTDLRPVGLIGGRNRKFKLTKKRRVK